MEVDSMAVSLWPKTGRSTGLSGECGCKNVDGANSAFSNWIEIVVMWRAEHFIVPKNFGTAC